jgi:chromosome segregation ATPase
MIEIDTGDSNISDHKLTRMKKGDIIALFRETEQKLFGFTTSANKAVVEIEELNERIDDHMIQEDMNKKTINELNESNKKLMEKVKFYQDQKENNKKKDNKIADYLNNGLIEKIESLEELNKNLEKEKEELIDVCKNKNEMNEALEEEIEKWKQDIDENYKHHYDQFEPVLLENEKLKEKIYDLNRLFNNYVQDWNSVMIVDKFIKDCCEECENIKDGIIEVAPTELNNLYCDFKDWCLKEDLDAPRRNRFKEGLKKWQENSRFGLDIGEKKSVTGINGYEAKPRFNLKVI